MLWELQLFVSFFGMLLGTPWKINGWKPKVMEVDVSDDFPDFNWVIFRGCAHPEANSSAPEKGVF